MPFPITNTSNMTIVLREKTAKGLPSCGCGRKGVGVLLERVHTARRKPGRFGKQHACEASSPEFGEAIPRRRHQNK